MTNTNYLVSIMMPEETILALLNSGYYLYGFKAIQTSDAAVMPLVWFRTQSYSTKTKIFLRNKYQAYTSTSTITPSEPIRVAFSTPIELDQLLTVQQSTGEGLVNSEGVPEVISILNRTNISFTCGISEEQNDSFWPVCALPLYGNTLQLIAPIPKILLMFSTVPVEPGTAIRVSYGPGVLIDLGNAEERTVFFDINNGWRWEEYSWAQSIPANSKLVPLLAEPSKALASLAGQIVERNHACVSS